MRKHSFKRGLAGFAAITTMCATLPVLHLSAAKTLTGDLDLDSTVSVNDVVLMQKYLFGKADLSGSAFENADLCADKIINGFDMAFLKRLVLSSVPVTAEVTIHLNDSGITVEGDTNKAVQISGKTAKITASGLYHIDGEITDGQILIETAAEDTADVELELNDVTMTNTTKPCIYTSAASGSDKTKLTLLGTSTLTDNAAAAYAESGAIYTNNKLTITKNSTGTLNVNSSMNTGIYSAKKMNLNGGTIVVNTADFSDTADADAIVADNELEIEGAVLDIDSSADGLKSKDEGVFLISGDVTVKAGNDAVQGVTEITISGGTLTAGGDRGFRLDEAGALNITGGTVLATATDYQVTGAGVNVSLAGSTQPVMMLDMAAEWKKDNAIVIGKNTYQPCKKYSYVLVSDAALTANGTYQVTVGGSAMNHSKDTTGKFQNTGAVTQYLNVAAMTTGSDTAVTTGTVSTISYGTSGVTLYDASGNTVSGGDAVSVSGSEVTIRKAGEYEVNGKSTGGRLVVNTDDTAEPTAVVQLNLTGLELSNSSMAPVYVQNVGDECVISAKSGSVNTISDGTSHTDSHTNSEGTAETINAAIFACDDLKIKGSGALTVNGNTGDGIVCKNDLKLYNGSVTVNAVDDAVRGNDSVTIGNDTATDFSTLNLTVNAKGGDGIKTKATSTTEGEGAVTINGGTVNVTANSDAIHATLALTVNGGELNLKTTGSATSTADVSAKGLKAGCTTDAGTAVTGTINVNGGYIVADTTDDAIHASGNVTLVGGKMEINTGDDAVHSDADVIIGQGTANTYDDVQIVVYSGYEGIEGLNITMNSGTVISTTTDDGFNAAGGADGSGSGGMWGGGWGGSSGGNYSLNLKGGCAIVSTANGDHDGFDSNGSLTISGGIHITNGQDPFDCDGTLSYTGGVYVKNTGSGGMGGGMRPGMGGGSMTESVNVSASVSANTRVTLCDGSGNVIVSFITDKAVSSLVAGCTGYTGAAFYTGGTLNGASYFQQMDASQLAAYGGTLSGGTAVGSSSSGSQWGF
jgi:hypothetical protein